MVTLGGSTLLDAGTRSQIAASLRSAEDERRALSPLSASWPGLEVADAYAIQLEVIASRLAEGAVIRGHKVGLSSRAMQRMVGVDQPDYGHLLSTMFVAESERAPVEALIQPKVEMEVAFVLGAPLRGPGCTVADVLSATAWVCPSLEIIDSRIADWKIGITDTIADNASSARVVLGGRRTSLDRLDLRTLGAVLRVDGEVVQTGAAGAVLGNPAKAVAWLANTVHRFGVALEPGHVILPGACSAAVAVRAGSVVRADFDQLGHVSCRF